MTTEDIRLELQSQGLPDFQDELAIIEAKFKLDESFKVVGIKSGKVSRGEVIECTRRLLTETKNDGGMHRITTCHIGIVNLVMYSEATPITLWCIYQVLMKYLPHPQSTRHYIYNSIVITVTIHYSHRQEYRLQL